MSCLRVKIDSLERVMVENANKLEALKIRYAARLEKERLKREGHESDPTPAA